MSISSRPIVSLYYYYYYYSFEKWFAHVPVGAVYEEALGTTTLIRPYLARALLGWQPIKAGLIDGLPIYYAAYLASRD